MVGENRCRVRPAKRLEQLDLHSGIGDVILAADDMGHFEVQVIDDGGQGVEIAAVLAQQDRIRQRGRVDMAVATHEIRPAHDTGIELEPPMRPLSFRFESGSVGGGQAEGGTIIDRRQAPALLTFALSFELVGSFVARIEAPERLQPFRRRVIKEKALRLPHGERRRDAEPGEIDFDRLNLFLLRTFEISVIEPQNESSMMAPSEEEIQKRRSRIADVDAAGGRRGEADRGSRHGMPGRIRLLNKIGAGRGEHHG